MLDLRAESQLMFMVCVVAGLLGAVFLLWFHLNKLLGPIGNILGAVTLLLALGWLGVRGSFPEDCALLGASILAWHVLREPNLRFIKWTIVGMFVSAIVLCIGSENQLEVGYFSLVNRFYQNPLLSPIGPLFVYSCAIISGSARVVFSNVFSEREASVGLYLRTFLAAEALGAAALSLQTLFTLRNSPSYLFCLDMIFNALDQYHHLALQLFYLCYAKEWPVIILLFVWLNERRRDGNDSVVYPGAPAMTATEQQQNESDQDVLRRPSQWTVAAVFCWPIFPFLLTCVLNSDRVVQYLLHAPNDFYLALLGWHILGCWLFARTANFKQRLLIVPLFTAPLALVPLGCLITDGFGFVVMTAALAALATMTALSGDPKALSILYKKR